MSAAELEMNLDILRAGEKAIILFDRKIHCFDVSFLSNKWGKTIHQKFLMGKEKKMEKVEEEEKEVGRRKEERLKGEREVCWSIYMKGGKIKVTFSSTWFRYLNWSIILNKCQLENTCPFSLSFFFMFVTQNSILDLRNSLSGWEGRRKWGKDRLQQKVWVDRKLMSYQLFSVQPHS